MRTTVEILDPSASSAGGFYSKAHIGSTHLVDGQNPSPYLASQLGWLRLVRTCYDCNSRDVYKMFTYFILHIFINITWFTCNLYNYPLNWVLCLYVAHQHPAPQARLLQTWTVDTLVDEQCELASLRRNSLQRRAHFTSSNRWITGMNQFLTLCLCFLYFSHISTLAHMFHWYDSSLTDPPTKLVPGATAKTTWWAV